MSKHKPLEPYLHVDIIKPSQEDLDKYYENTGEMKMSDSSKNSLREFKKAVIGASFDEEKYPIGSTWMMGESPGIIVNFFGEKIVMIQEKDLYSQI